MKLAYRPDIDGLRAIAVSVVVLYHAYPNAVKKGFIGVDMFFVISGYLITNIILREFAAGTFTLTDFYARRFKRILPAFLTVVVATLALGFVFLKPDEFANLLKHAAASLMFSENFLLLSEVDYFDRAAEYKPLLHIWSLSVEEQFYLFWPLLLMVFVKKQRFLSWVIGGVVMASLITNFVILNMKGNPLPESHAFYMLHTRMWELGVGAMAAWLMLNKPKALDNFQTKKLAEFVNLCAIIVIFLSFFNVISDMIKPIYVVFGTFIILIIGEKTWLNRYILASKPFVFLGLISYPLYLWHWTLFSVIQLVETLLVILSAIVLSWLTFRFIEKPLRHVTVEAKKTVIISLIVLFSGALLCFVTATFMQKSEAVQKSNLDIFVGLRAKYQKNCPYDRFKAFYSCAANFPDSKAHTLVFGDSHAGVYFGGLAEKTLPFSMITSNGCDPSPVTKKPNLLETGNRCKGEYAYYTKEIFQNKSIETIILTFFQSRAYKEKWRVGTSEYEFNTHNLELHRAAFDEMLAAGKKVILALDYPILPNPPSHCVKRYIFTPPVCSLTRAMHDKNTASYKKIVEEIRVKYPQIRIYDPTSVFCDEQKCKIFEKGEILYYDADHLTITGSRLVADDFMKWLEAKP